VSISFLEISNVYDLVGQPL